jgi:hypothetical protein
MSGVSLLGIPLDYVVVLLQNLMNAVLLLLLFWVYRRIL